MRKAIEYVHSAQKKAYLALNTLIKDEEFDEAIEYARHAVSAGVDAIIVQDIGLFSALSRYNVPLIASTQLTVCNSRGVKMTRSMGFKRVVLSRELNVSEIEAIAKIAEGIELECFIHGGLCIGYSGQCHASSVFDHKAANRGMCQTPCWDNYTLYRGDTAIDGGRIIKPKDMYGIHHIPLLEKIGVTALKLQGRTRNLDYVRTVVSTYRKYIDRMESALSTEPSEEEKALLEMQSPRGLMKGNLELSRNESFVIKSDYVCYPKPRHVEEYEEAPCAKPEKISVRLYDLCNIDPEGLSRNISRIYLSYDLFTSANCNKIASLRSVAPIYMVMPTLIERYDASVDEVSELVKKYGISGISMSNIGDLIYARHISCDFTLERSFNVCNRHTAEYLKEYGASCMSLPFELTPEECVKLSGRSEFSFERTVYGRPTLMQMKYCLISKSNECPEKCAKCSANEKYALVGENKAFLVYINSNRTETTLLPMKKIALPILDNDAEYCRFEFSDESTEQINVILDMYSSGHYPIGDYISDIGSI